MGTLKENVTGIVVKLNELPADIDDLDERTHAELLLRAESLYNLLDTVVELYKFADLINPSSAARAGSGADPLQIADTALGRSIIGCPVADMDGLNGEDEEESE